MSEPLSASDRFLQQLADGLEVLGPTETSEVLAEVQSHLADAIAEAGGNESEALAQFGSPDLLAMRILEERGILRAGPAVPEARGSRRLAALVINVALWLLLLWLFSIPVVGMGVFSSVPLAGAVLGWTVLAALAAATLWWWVKKRRERGYVTPGMHVMGLRRIRVGQTTRMVRERDIPGLARRNGARVAAVLGVLLAVLILAAMSYSVFSHRAADRQAEVQTAVWDSATGVDDRQPTLPGRHDRGSAGRSPGAVRPGCERGGIRTCGPALSGPDRLLLDQLRGPVVAHAAGRVGGQRDV